MAIKSDRLMALEKAGVLWQDKTDSKWYNGFREDVDLTPYLYAAGMFEH